MQKKIIFVIGRYNKKIGEQLRIRCKKDQIYWFVKNKRFKMKYINFIKTSPYPQRKYAYSLISHLLIMHGNQIDRIVIYGNDLSDLRLANYSNKIQVYFIESKKDFNQLRNLHKFRKLAGLLPFDDNPKCYDRLALDCLKVLK